MNLLNSNSNTNPNKKNVDGDHGHNIDLISPLTTKRKMDQMDFSHLDYLEQAKNFTKKKHKKNKKCIFFFFIISYLLTFYL